MSNVPSDTTNILAWNGGGSANYTEIVAKGGYTVGAMPSESVKEQLSEVVKEQFSEVSEEAVEILKKIEGKLEDFLVEELKALKAHA